MAQDKIRIYALARELNMETKDLLDLCQKANIDVKNQLSSLDPEQRDLVVELVKRGGPAALSASSPQQKGAPNLPQNFGRVKTIDTRRAPTARSPEAPRPPEVAPEALEQPSVTPDAVVETVAAPEAAPPVTQAPAAEEVPAVSPTPVPVEAPVKAAPPTIAPAAEKPAEPPVPKPSEPTAPPKVASPAPPPLAPVAQAPTTPKPASPTPPRPTPAAGQTPPARPSESPRTPRPLAPNPPPLRTLGGHGRQQGTGGPRQEGGGQGGGGTGSPPRPPIGRPRPMQDRDLRPRPQDYRIRRGEAPTGPPKKEEPPKKPAPPTGPKKLADITPEMMQGDKAITIEDLLRPPPRPGVGPVTTADVDIDDEEGDDADGKKKHAGQKKPTGVVGREDRHKQRSIRAQERQGRDKGSTRSLLVEESDRPTRSGVKLRQKKQKPTMPRKGKVPIELPITVRTLSSAMSIKAGDLLMLLMSHGAPSSININSVLDPELAEALALEKGCELDVKRPLSAEEEMIASAEKEDAPEVLQVRPPIVTIMGHVDHGKTSLLDRIRESNVVDTEAGGITQSLRAWSVDHNGRRITFLDTPGHEAFTKMRARGANVTDIAVIVVAATDGVMPQTEEAISHAKAAEVAIVVAINKVDLPNANIRRTEQQLYGLGLLPDNMGGDVPFIQTSAVTGKGVAELLEALLLVADLQLELKANPDRPAQGTCLEASVSEQEGVLATVLVQNGTLRLGDVVVCGASYGRVRALYSDLGLPIEQAGPSTPCRITGLDVVPNADDPFYVAEDLATAREIGERRKSEMQQQAATPRVPLRLESLGDVKVTELKVILKADVRGSLEAIRKELEKLQHEEVRVRVLHTAVGGITESDVNLALTSPEDTIIVGFNAVPDDRAKSQAEERGVQIREYNIIYKLTDDIRSALEGKLKPREEIVHLGRAVVRETFKISRVGTIAGCHVTQGTIERNARVRVIRSGVVVYPPPDRTTGLDSLKRFKEDVREVREGYECGLKIAGYDDVKVDDVIEAYRVEQVQRTLS